MIDEDDPIRPETMTWEQRAAAMLDGSWEGTEDSRHQECLNIIGHFTGKENPTATGD